MKSALPVIVAISLLAPEVARPPAAADESPFVVGVLRRDGRVLPFTTYDGRRWTTKWPTEIRWIDVPIALHAVPEDWWGRAALPKQMTMWADGASRGTVTLGNPEPMPIACDRRLTLKSDYIPKETAPVRFVQPYPKDGLVVSGDKPVERIESIERGSTAWQDVASLVLDQFNRAEDRAASAFNAWRHPVPSRDRRKLPMEIEAVYRTPMDEGGTAYFVEALRRYPPRPEDEGCGLVTLVSGWVLQGPKKPEFELQGLVSYCDRRGAIYMLPLGLVRAGERTFWVYQLSGYGTEVYRISRPQQKRVTHEISYTAAWCVNP